MAVAEASFRISIETMSDGLMDDSALVLLSALPEMGTPSMTYNGSLPFSELIPRMLTEIPPPGAPEFCVTCTPAARPCKAWSSDVMTDCLISSSPTDTTEPVRSLRFIVP